jgi:rhomboid-related protein 1/2/3
VDYKSGPYHQTDGPHLNPSVKGLPDATVIEKVHREHLCVEEAVSSTDNFPFLMILVSLAQVICFAYWAPKFAVNGEITATSPVAGPQYLWFKTVRNWPYCNDRRQFWYMTLSYQLVHSGLEHIMFNIVLQLIFGIPIELVHGAIVFFIYEVGVIMGALACALSDPYIAVVGCSGGVYCLFGIHVAHMMLNWKDMKHSAVPREMRVLVFGMLFGSEVVAWWCLNTAGKSFAAHAGGALAGFLMGVGFMTNFEIEEWEVYMRWFCRFCFAFFVVLGVIWYVVKDPPAPLSMWGYGDKNKIPCCFQMFDCDIERSYKYYNIFSCSRDLEDDKNSYQYRLQTWDEDSPWARQKGGNKNPFEQCNRIRQQIVDSCQNGYMKQMTGSNCADDPSTFTTSDIGPYKHYFSSNE